MLQDQGNNTYGWLNSYKSPIYILPRWIGDSFEAGDPNTWLLPDQLTLAGVMLNSKEHEYEEQEDEENKEEIPEEEGHFDQPKIQHPMYHQTMFH